MAQLRGTRQTSEWRQYYRQSCVEGGYPNAGHHLYLTQSFRPHLLEEVDSVYNSAAEMQQASDECALVMVFTISYDHDEDGRLTREVWSRIVAVLKQMTEPEVRVQLWIDKIDSASRTTSWGIDQLLPYILFPVVRVGTREDAGFWSNMEGLAGIFGRGLYHDNSLSPAIVQYHSPIVGKDFFASRAATFNPGDAIVTFYVHLMFGTLTKYRNHHKEALEKLAVGTNAIALIANPSNWLELILGHERNSRYDPGRFEILNGFQCRTDVPKWHGLKEWITVSRWIHPVFAPETIGTSMPAFNIRGFVNVYEATETYAIVHWTFRTGWIRRLLVKLSHGSREQGHGIWHLRLPGYRHSESTQILEQEGAWVADGYGGSRKVYSFDSFHIRWT